MSDKIKPLFMWAGGKTRMIRFYQQNSILPDTVNVYSEPFFGGGAMFLYVMAHYAPRECFINDINPGIINIYLSIRDDVDEFINQVSQLESQFLPLIYDDRKKFYYDIRHQHAFDYEGWSSVREAATLFFLMKTGFNGLWQINQNTNHRFGTPCGLLRQTTEIFNPANVRAWHDLLQTTTITTGDWRDAVPEAHQAFYFLDPPYRGSVTSYGQSFTDDDQRALLDFAKSVPNHSRVLLCNDDAGDGFFEQQGRLKMLKFEIMHTAGRRKRTDDGHKAKAVTEIVLHNAPVVNGLVENLFDFA